jgi:hypothetical protein
MLYEAHRIESSRHFHPPGINLKLRVKLIAMGEVWDMKLENLTASSNLHVDCLGKRVGINSEEASAAFECQNTVRSLREKLTQELLGDLLKGGQVKMNSLDLANVDEAEAISKVLTNELMVRYVSAKEKAPVRSDKQKEDSIANRTMEFKSIFNSAFKWR